MKKVVFYTQAYNSEKYIKKCIDSVLSQTYEEFDYYLIDNGSTDNTWDVILEYSRRDTRIIPVHIENNTRHLLEKYIHVAHEKGYQYIATLDSDDWYESDFLNETVRLLEETDSDMVTCGTLFLPEGGKETFLKRPSDKVLCVEEKQFGVSFPYLYSYYGATWGRVYKLKVFVENNVEPWKDVYYGIDTSLVLQYQSCCNKVTFSPKVLHNYLVRKNSVSSSFNEQSLSSNENFYKHLIEYLKRINGLTELNITFSACVYMGLITNTNVNTLLSDAVSYETNLSILCNTLTSKITHECWDIIKYADSQINRIFDTDGMISKYTETLLKYICKIYNKKDNDKFYTMICFLFPLFNEMCEEEDVGYWIKNNELLYLLMNLKNNEVVFKMIDVLPKCKNSYNLWKALKRLLKKNAFLSSIDKKLFITEYPNVVKDIYSSNIDAAISKIIDILTNGKENKFDEELLSICLNISAATENAPLFVLLKKLQAELYIQERRIQEAAIAIDNLTEMCPDDEDVIMLKKCLEN
jgi:glycosyltransferase involved in cell wall biosynthesis